MNMGRVLVVEDDPALREAVCDTLQIGGYAVAEAGDGRAALEMLGRDDIRLVVTDIRMQHMDGHALLRHIKSHQPDIPVLLMTAYGSIDGAVMAMREGAVDYLVKPFEPEALLDRVRRFVVTAQVAEEEVIAADPASLSLLQLARRVADSDVTVMISGASGTGKEVVAHFIHRHSRRSGGPFVAINCAAIPENMLEATLFGYEKGAFTGAYQAAPGKFELAQGGMLLLDEISEMDLGLQAKLLRVLQEKEVERLGGRRSISLDVRVLATTNRDLAAEVTAGRFRGDLFYRLNVFPLHLPPLRERPGDILPLARRAVARAAKLAGRRAPELSEGACARMLQHSWPGNVRELDNVMQRAMILQAGTVVAASDLHFESAPVSAPAQAPVSTPVSNPRLDPSAAGRKPGPHRAAGRGPAIPRAGDHHRYAARRHGQPQGRSDKARDQPAHAALQARAHACLRRADSGRRRLRAYLSV